MHLKHISALPSLNTVGCMVHLPPEIWLYITHFIPHADIYPQLLGLNQAFFYTALDIKWREVDIWTRALVQTLRALKRLRCVVGTE